MERRTLLAVPFAATLGGLAAPHVATAQGVGSWPERPIRMLIPFPPGGSNDTVARIVT